ncbi:heme exporter protein CcmD [Rhodobacterales bacterium 52_120_T64]|nr:heme exporter protein CcmD [Rhodobacterales bacterium 52_120_T64]
MPDLGKYGATILTAYSATIILVVAMVVLSVVRARKVKRQLAELEARRNG